MKMNGTPPFKRTVFSTAIPSLVGLQAQYVESVMREKGTLPARTEPFTYETLGKGDMVLITNIVARGVEILRARGMPADHPLDVDLMAQDIATVHCHIVPLHLLRWHMSDQSDFMSDFAGLSLHLDRSAGVLLRGWRPIFAKET
jgi:hypothetical protein